MGAEEQHGDRRVRDRTWPRVDLDGVTELRVHGVGGTPVTEVLDDTAAEQVSGDGVAGVWRSRAGAEDDEHPAQRWRLEAYSWGGLTGRSAVRALWLLLLPFSLVNLAGWMAPAREGRFTGARRGLARLVSLGLTGLYVLFAAQLGMDFLGVQCAGDPDCSLSGTWPLRADDPVTRRAVWGAVVPLLVVVLLWALGRRSRNQYELWRTTRKKAGGRSDDLVRGGLARPRFWSGQAYADRLAAVHIGVSLVVVALLLGTTTTGTTDGWAGPAVVALCAAYLALGAVLSLNSRLRNGVPVAATYVCAAALLILAAVVAWTAPGGAEPLTLPGMVDVFDIVVDVTIAAGIGLTVADLLILRGQGVRPLERALRLFGPLSAVTLAVLLAGAFLSGVTMFIADFFGDLRSSARAAVARTADGGVVLAYPQPFEGFARAFLLAPLVLVIGAAAGLLFVAVTQRAAITAATERRLGAWELVDPPGPGACSVIPPAGEPGGRRDRRPDWSFWMPVTALGAAVGGLVAVTLVAVLVSVLYCGYRAVWRVTAADGAVDDLGDLDTMTWGLIPLRLGVAALTFLPVLLVFFLRRGLTQQSTRRSIAVFWDVLTFWPRSFHPLAPPSYAERAVPEIQVRLDRIWRAGGRCVLLGHSQGSVLAAAAVAGLPPDDPAQYRGTPLADRLALITYGSPLSRLYGRFFPAYFDSDFFTGLGRRLDGGWVSFYRDTDPVGRMILAPAESVRNVFLPDPATHWWFEGDGNPPVLRHGHDGYRTQHEFRRQLLAQVRRLHPGPPARPAPPVPPVPPPGGNRLIDVTEARLRRP